MVSSWNSPTSSSKASSRSTHSTDYDKNDRYTFHEDTRQIIGQRSRKTYSLGDRCRVLVDRIDPVEKKIQFAILEEQPKPSIKSRRK